jgi:hypothetical protein
LLLSRRIGRRAAREELFMRANRILVILMMALLIAVTSTAALAKPQESSVKRFEIGTIGTSRTRRSNRLLRRTSWPS